MSCHKDCSHVQNNFPGPLSPFETVQTAVHNRRLGLARNSGKRFRHVCHPCADCVTMGKPGKKAAEKPKPPKGALAAAEKAGERAKQAHIKKKKLVEEDTDDLVEHEGEEEEEEEEEGGASDASDSSQPLFKKRKFQEEENEEDEKAFEAGKKHSASLKEKLAAQKIKNEVRLKQLNVERNNYPTADEVIFLFDYFIGWFG